MAFWHRWIRRGTRSREPTAELTAEQIASQTAQSATAAAEALAAVMSRSLSNQLRAGRISVDPLNWNWNPFSWIARRNQQAHQLDFTTLKRLSAAELLQILISTHPDISAAVWQFMRMADTHWAYTVSKLNGKGDPASERVIAEAIANMESPGLSPGFELSSALATKIHQLHLVILVRGGFALEVEPTPNLRGIKNFHVIDPADIEFRPEADGRLVPWQRVAILPRNIPPDQHSLWLANYKRLDSPTIIWEALDPFPNDPYGREPLLPTLQVVFFEIQVLSDLQAVVHNQGYPRLEVKVLQQVIMERVKQFMPQLLTDPEQLSKFLTDELAEIAGHFESLEPDDAITHWDTTEVKSVGVEGKGPMIDVKKLIEIIEARIATGCKTFLTLLSRHTGTAEGMRKTDTQIYLKSIAGIQKVAARGWSRALTVALNLLGRQGQVVFSYEAPDLRTPDEQEKDFGARMDNAFRLRDEGYLTEQQAYQYIFDRTAPADLDQQVAERRKKQPQPPPQPSPRGGGGNT